MTFKTKVVIYRKKEIDEKMYTTKVLAYKLFGHGGYW